MTKEQGIGTARGVLPFLRGEGRYLFLLVSLLLLLFFYPFFEGLHHARRVLGGVLFFILLSGIHSLSASRRPLLVALFLSLLGYGSFVAGWFAERAALQAVTAICFALFFGLMTAVIAVSLWRVRRVTVDTILGAVCAYLLLGMTWTMVFALIETLSPGSYAAGGQSLAAYGGERREIFAGFIYYSFVTLTTLGYGDIAPLSSPARSLAALEAVMGQMFIAVLVARLVGMEIASSGKGP